ncbi:hypothetical protein KSS87_004354 [Heliosperma pusillum]|nr:hypothetical protein KSS87_004354 [Heliosperma pusillum]
MLLLYIPLFPFSLPMHPILSSFKYYPHFTRNYPSNMDYYTLLTLIIILPLSFLHFYRRRNHLLPPGNYGLPLIGETLQLISAYKTENPEPFTDERVARFGPVFTTHIFGEATIFSADPDVNRYILQNEGKLFECSYPGSISNLLGKHSLLLMTGSLHKRMHSFTMSFVNSSIIRDHLLVDIDRLVRFFLGSWPDRVLLMEEAKKITFALTMKQLMSLDPCDWTESLRKEYLLVIEGFFSIPLPFFSTAYNRAIKARTKVAEALTLVVRERRKEIEQGESKDDILGALLKEEVEGGRLSDEVIVDFLVSLLVAGYETTSTLMTLAVKFVTETPLALAQLKRSRPVTCGIRVTSITWEVVHGGRGQAYGTGYHDKLAVEPTLKAPKADGTGYHDKLAVEPTLKAPIGVELTLKASGVTEQENIKARKGDKEALVWADYKSMPFTQCVINETLRVSNIIGGIFRRTTSDIQIRGYTIPKGWKVFASFRAVHMDDQHFKDARSFNPWRWQSDTGTTCSPGVFSPFGGGPRLCPGYEIARVSVCVFLHHLVTIYSWQAAEEDKLLFFPTTRTQKRMPINVQRLVANM